jgi:hypothetical protein
MLAALDEVGLVWGHKPLPFLTDADIQGVVVADRAGGHHGFCLVTVTP